MTMPNRMNKVDGHAIGVAVFVIPPVVIAALGWVTLSAGFGAFLSLAWIAMYLYQNLEIINQTEWKNVNRFGLHFDVKLAGLVLYCAKGFIDKIQGEGTLMDVEVELFSDSSPTGGREALDFLGGVSSPVEIKMVAGIGRKHGTRDQIKEDVRRYVYSIGDPKRRAKTVAESELRVVIQSKTLDEMNQSACRKEITAACIAEISDGLKVLGMYLGETQPILIEDIAVPAKVVELREVEYKATIEATASRTEADAIRDSITAITHGKDGKEVCSWEEATRIWEGQKARETLAKASANVTLIGTGVGAVTNTLSLDRR